MMQGKLKKGKMFSKPQERLNRIYEVFEDDMMCAFCEQTYLYNKIAEVIGYHSSEQKVNLVE